MKGCGVELFRIDDGSLFVVGTMKMVMNFMTGSPLLLLASMLSAAMGRKSVESILSSSEDIPWQVPWTN